jgi:hypothetical protein
MGKRYTLLFILGLVLLFISSPQAFAQQRQPQQGQTPPSSSFQLKSTMEFGRNANVAIDPRSEIRMFPNPATEYLYIELTDSSLRNVDFELNNIIGNQFALKAEQVSDTHYKIYVKDLRAGYYFLTIKDQDSPYKRTYRFVKK